ncbi:TPA: hypothetical protein ACPZF7_004150 [Yersinia enterocolitica]|uniref:hypothetical protein n=1 Tax=Yersinia enterocolitica TaxID=630 RepID=UPI002AC756EF|nr:hypothetical protein [Yersinia enterocolitica]EKN4023217.1 hypothetical protein [Yersinia enterocolitica]EKN4157210.1 hypothetical protein [Yersinia enterocolitica]EKN6048866.1 hypothetical protein [Yersinia enterocolitica]HEN3539657.1 hypothetical protein [Yersinia enterocolitica]
MKINAEKKLTEVQSFMIKAAQNYSDISEFVMNLNACIQAIRNVTFYLQAQKKEISNFDSWYLEWQNALKKDPIMRWCIDARNKIVKQSDLEINSKAILSVKHSYNGSIKYTSNVPIFIPDLILAQDFLIENKRFSTIKGVLQIEKMWVSSDLEEIELLDILVHAFTVLTELVKDVEIKIGPSIIYKNEMFESDFVKKSDFLDLTIHLLPKSVFNLSQFRVNTYSLPDLRKMEVSKEIVRFDDEMLNEARDRYKFKVNHKFVDSESLKENVLALTEYAIELMKVDSHHITLIFLSKPGSEGKMIRTVFDDHESKILFWEKIAKIVKRKRYDKILVVGEAWTAIADLSQPFKRVDEYVTRKDTLLVTGLSKCGDMFTTSTIYSLQGETISFQETIENNLMSPTFLSSIRKVWEKELKFNR